MDIEWTGAAIEPTEADGPPDPDTWESVAVPGRPAAMAGAERVAYRGHFPDPRESDDERGLLVVRGVYATATVWVNGQRVAEGDLAAPIRAPFEPLPENELIVTCSAPTDRFGGAEDTDRIPARKRVPSIRGGVSVSAVPPAYIHDLQVRGNVADDEATIEVAALVDAGEAVDDRLTLSLRPEGFRGGGSMERATVTAEPGERVAIQRSLRVRDARRWWPRGLGQQFRYTVRAKLGDHERTATTGLVTVDRDGGDLLLNGRRHRPRGVIVPPTADPEVAVERALDANATMVRARAHVPTESLAEACDEAGLLYWQDLPLTGSGSFDLDRGRSIAADLAAARGHHPSLVWYGVHDDPADPFGGSVGSGRLDRLRFRWRAWRASVDRANVEALSGSLPSEAVVFPVTGPPGTDPDAAHVYPGWEYLDATDVDWLLERYPAAAEVVGATGAGSLTKPTNADVPGLASHALPEGDEADPDATQAAQVRTVTTVLEALRRRGVGTVVLDSIVDAAPAGGTGVVAADGTEKPALRAVADAFEPIQAVLDDPPTGGATPVTVCNDTAVDRDLELAWHAGSRNGSVDVTVGAFERADAGAVTIPDDADRCTLECRLGDATVTNTYDLTLWR